MSDGTGSTVITTAAFNADVADVERESAVADADAASAAASAALCQGILDQIMGLVNSGQAGGLLTQILQMASYATEAAAAATAAAASAATATSGASVISSDVALATTQASSAQTSANAAAVSAAAAAATAASLSGTGVSATASATAAATSAGAAAASATTATGAVASIGTSVSSAAASATAAASSATTALGASSSAAGYATSAMTAANNAQAVALNYLVVFTLTGLLGISEIIPHNVAIGMTLPVGLAGSRFSATAAATASCVMTLVHVSGGSNTPVGTLTWAVGATVPTISFTSPVFFAAGDTLLLKTPASPDTTLANIGLSILGQI